MLRLRCGDNSDNMPWPDPAQDDARAEGLRAGS
jgi:hypothetical protein